MTSQAILASRRLGVPPLFKHEINLNVDRSRGEKFDAYNGSFFYVESCDLPCRAVFGGGDGDVSAISLSSGLQLNDDYSGFVLFHGDYTQKAGRPDSAIRFYTSTQQRAFTQFVSPQIQMTLPYSVEFVEGGEVRYSVPVPLGTKTMSLTGVLSVNHGALVGDVPNGVHKCDYYDKNGEFTGVLTDYTQNGKNYTVDSANALGVTSSVFLSDLGAGKNYLHRFSAQVAIPSAADYIVFSVSFNGVIVFNEIDCKLSVILT